MTRSKKEWRDLQDYCITGIAMTWCFNVSFELLKYYVPVTLLCYKQRITAEEANGTDTF